MSVQWNSQYNLIMQFYFKYIYFVVADSCGLIFLLQQTKRKSVVFRHFYLNLGIWYTVLLNSSFTSENRIKVHNMVTFYTHIFKIVYIHFCKI